MRAAIAFFAIVLAVGCGSDSNLTEPTPTPVGTWNLQTIGGGALPYIAYDGTDGRVELASERLTIGGSTFTIHAVFRQTVGSVVTMIPDSLVGWATINGSVATLVSPDYGIYVDGKMEGGKFTIDQGIPYVYIRP